ncbi:MAG TPA: VWA domain-containing protein [Vicinamibacterales bacterium]|jgi:VWFA-related protein|nr:VWA domain-containing protein [Vicinamibacterales bacterium]
MTLRRLRLSLAFAACVGATISLWAQAASELPVLKILSPGDEAFVTGPTLLRASLTPPDAVTALTFFVDGRQVCALTNPPFECDWDAGATITAHQVRAVATVKGGSRIVQTIRTKSVGYVERVDVDVVQVTVTVSDGRGKFVRSIPQSAFHVFEDGRPQTVTHFTSEDVPLELVAAIDISGSMAPAMPKLKTAVKEFLGDVPPQDQVTLLGFNDNIFTLTRKATDPAERVKAVDRLAPWGSTALYDVLLRGVEMLGRQTGRKALVVFTDGEDQGSHATINDVERRLQSSDVTLYMIGQGRGVTMEPLKKIMERLSVPTGGRALFTDSIDELHAAFADLLDELSNQYLLGYQSSNSRRDDAWRKIKVDVDGHHEVRARQGYRALAGK